MLGPTLTKILIILHLIRKQKELEKADRIFSEENTLKIINDCRNKEGIVKEESKERKEYSEALFDLTSLQRESNSRFGFTASTTLKIAQSLYQPISGEGYITYPRTDSRRLPDGYDEEVTKLLNSFNDSSYKSSPRIF